MDEIVRVGRLKSLITKQRYMEKKMKINKKVILVVLSVVILTLFTGCITDNTKTNNTPDEQVVNAEQSKTSDIKQGYSSAEWCPAGKSIQTMTPKGNTATLEVRGITTFEGNEVCETGWIHPEEGSLTIYTSKDMKYTVTIIKDKNGIQTDRIGGSIPKT